MAQGFSNQEVQKALTEQCLPCQPPTLRQMLVLHSEEGLEIFAIVDGRGGERYKIQDYEILAIYENTSFAHAFHGRAVGDCVTFLETLYLIAGHTAEDLPNPSDCKLGMEIDQTLRQAIAALAGRYDYLAHILGEQRERLKEDRDTLQIAKYCRVYLFEQDRWITEECQEQKRLDQQLASLRSSYQFRQIASLRQCYEQELEQLRSLEIEITASVTREQERQNPLRKRRPVVLRANDEARRKREHQRIVRKEHEEAKQLEDGRIEREREFNVWWAATHYRHDQKSPMEVPQASKNINTPSKKIDTHGKVNQTTVNHSCEAKATSKIKPASATLQVCPQCGCYVRPDRQDVHMVKKHGVLNSQKPSKPSHSQIGSNFAAKVSQTEDIRYSSDAHDGSKDIGFLEREEGRFGSFPGHDDYEDEASP